MLAALLSMFILLLMVGCNHSALYTKNGSVRNDQISRSAIKIPVDFDSNCHVSEPVVGRAANWEGYVSYRETAHLYSIVYTIPNSADSQWIGLTCNMPNEFKHIGQRVKFTGRYYYAYKYVQRDHAGETMLYLVLEKIETYWILYYQNKR